MLDRLKKILSSHDWLEDLVVPKNKTALFVLSYENLVIGELSLEKGNWEFKYSELFKRQEELKPIVDFPDKTKIYQSEKLWPFFASRIPSTSRPSIKEIIDNTKIDPNDLVELLKLFGKQTIANPYKLSFS